MRINAILYSCLANKCPRCHRGDVFKNKNPFNLKHMSQMHENCSHCGEKYEKEPGGYYGAMYVSYGLMAGWFIICWAIDSFLIQSDIFNFLLFLIISIIVFMPLTFRISRLLWLNIFIKFDPKKSI